MLIFENKKAENVDVIWLDYVHLACISWRRDMFSLV